MNKGILKLLVVILILSLMSACSSGGEASGEAMEEPVEEEPVFEEKQETEKPGEGKRIALLLVGSISDAGWNSSAYDGLMALNDMYGFETSYTESISYADTEEVTRTYADAGCDIIFGHAYMFYDVFKRVAPEYPDIKFICSSATEGQSPNLVAVTVDDKEQGFLAGCVAGLMTESDIVAGVGGIEMPPSVRYFDGYRLGVAYIDENIKVLQGMTGSNGDPSLMKETAQSMIAQGADIILTSGNRAGIGTIEACAEAGVMAIGGNSDQNSVAPDSVLVSVEREQKLMMLEVADRYLAGELEPTYINIGISDGAIYLSPWHSFEDKVEQDVKDRLEEIIAGLISGEISVSEMK